jgi:cell division protein FtsA
LDCRVGYPNEHLAKNEVLPKVTYEDLKSPLYATSIGLLIKGVQASEDIPVREEAPVKEKMEEKVPEKTGIGLFDRLLKKTTEFIKDDISDEDFLSK